MKKIWFGLFLVMLISGCSDIVFASIKDDSKKPAIRMKEITKQDVFESQAIKAILGEGEDQGYVGMVCLGEAIRNRGTLKGVYGYKVVVVKDNKFYRKTKKGLREITPNIVSDAKRAWKESENTDYLHGADHWENVKAFGVPVWAKGMRIMFEHKDHVFFKE